jgi:pimeloyl-ACP methyl ester carboxylesterase
MQSRYGPFTRMRRSLICHPLAGISLLITALASASAAAPTGLLRVPSKDGTSIAFECAGSGPTLLMVHGGVGDRTRWTPMFPLLSSHFTVCAMDRRGRGASGDSPVYSLRKEAEDIAAVVDSRRGTVFVLAHSYGALCALEAAFQTRRIAKLVLYEPPLLEHPDFAVIERIERLIREGDRDAAATTFLREVVKVSPAEIDAMRTRPTWRALLKSIDSHPRQMRALASYRFDARRMSTMAIPTLLIRGSETQIPDVKLARERLVAALPHVSQAVLEGQQHNAMDTGPEYLARAVEDFLLAPTAP